MYSICDLKLILSTISLYGKKLNKHLINSVLILKNNPFVVFVYY